VELASSLEEALLKGCLWINSESGEDSEGEKDEASQQSKISRRRSTNKMHNEEEYSKGYL